MQAVRDNVAHLAKRTGTEVAAEDCLMAIMDTVYTVGTPPTSACFSLATPRVKYTASACVPLAIHRGNTRPVCAHPTDAII